jgi:hypothetical protein
MSERHPDPPERDELTEQDLAIATLVGRYIERREQGTARVHDLLSVAAEFGDAAVDELRGVLAFYERCARATTSTAEGRRRSSAVHNKGGVHAAIYKRGAPCNARVQSASSR